MSSLRSFQVDYDASADVLYITRVRSDVARGRQDEMGIIWRYDPNGTLVGATVMDFFEVWSRDQEGLAEQLSSAFHIPMPHAEVVVDRAVELHDNPLTD